MNVLALVAHPDDLEIAAAGTICGLTDDNHRVLIGVVTDEADANIKRIRQAEAIEAAATMGVPATQVFFLGQEDRFAKNEKSACDLLSDWMQSHNFDPDVVITHSKNDTHQDHRAVHELALSATDQSNTLYLFAAVINSLRVKDFQPTVFVDTSNYWLHKKAALSCYPSQDVLGRIRVKKIDKHERGYAQHLGVSRVEAFEASYEQPFTAALLLRQFALPISTTPHNSNDQEPIAAQIACNRLGFNLPPAHLPSINI